VGNENNDRTVITDGLKDGEQVVLSNQYRLEPGARVRSVGATPTTNARSGGAKSNVS